MELEPITRQEKIIAGQDLTPITRMEKFLKQYGGGGSGGGSTDAVLYTAQTLTEAQKQQARENVDAAIADLVVNGTIANDGTVTLDKTFDQIQEAVQGAKKDNVRLMLAIYDGATVVLRVAMVNQAGIYFTASSPGSDSLAVVGVSVEKDAINFLNSHTLAYDSNGTIPQFFIDANPTMDMQIATKQYVDNKECILKSTTPGSTKKFKITVDDSGTLKATEVT